MLKIHKKIIELSEYKLLKELLTQWLLERNNLIIFEKY